MGRRLPSSTAATQESHQSKQDSRGQHDGYVLPKGVVPEWVNPESKGEKGH